MVGGVPFKEIYKQATEHKGGEKNLLSELPEIPTAKQIAAKPDSYFLSLMTGAVFRAGFVWRIIQHKWPGFEEAFYQFDIDKLAALSDEEWEAYSMDDRIVKNMQKVYALKHNVGFIIEIHDEHGGFGKFLSGWKKDDQIGMLDLFKKRASRLGGMTGQYFLRRAGWDGFIMSPDVVNCLTKHKLITGKPTGQKTLREVQELFNAWHAETGLPYTHLSMIAAKSMG